MSDDVQEGFPDDVMEQAMKASLEISGNATPPETSSPFSHPPVARAGQCVANNIPENKVNVVHTKLYQ